MSFGEIAILLVIGVVVVGPRKLPTLMRTTGQWISKLRRMSSDLRSQSGIDDLIRSEGLEKEIREIRALSRVNIVDTLVAPVMSPIPPKPPAAQLPVPPPKARPFVPTGPPREREFPLIGCDSYGALPDDAAPYVEEIKPATADAAGAAADPADAAVDPSATSAAPTTEVESVTMVVAPAVAATAAATAATPESAAGASGSAADLPVDSAFADEAAPTRQVADLRRLSFPLEDTTPRFAKTLASRTEDPSIEVLFAPPSFLSPSERAAEQADPFEGAPASGEHGAAEKSAAASDKSGAISDKSAAASDKSGAISDKSAAEPDAAGAQRAAS